MSEKNRKLLFVEINGFVLWNIRNVVLEKFSTRLVAFKSNVEQLYQISGFNMLMRGHAIIPEKGPLSIVELPMCVSENISTLLASDFRSTARLLKCHSHLSACQSLKHLYSPGGNRATANNRQKQSSALWDHNEASAGTWCDWNCQKCILFSIV